MSKKKLLFVYHSMIIGGSTTSLLAQLNNLDPQKYDIDLQLYRNEGPLLDMIPAHVSLLPAAERYRGKAGKIRKLLKFAFSGKAFRYAWLKATKKHRPANMIKGDFQVTGLSRKNTKTYDYVIGCMEGWSDKYAAFMTRGAVKYAWIHSTFSKISPEATRPLPWMAPFKKLVFVSDSCRDAFYEQIPEMNGRAITIENITDDDIVRERSLAKEDDAFLERMRSAEGLKLVTVCRVTRSVKGLDRVVSAAKALKKNGVDFLWYIIGDGDDTDALSNMIAAAGVGDKLIQIGRRMNPYPYLAAADIMCMPSRYEGKPMVVTEAMILGAVPVVTEYLSAREQIRAGEEGVIVENNDTSIIDTLLDLSSDRDRIAKMKDVLISRRYGNKEYIKEIETELFE